MKHFLLGTLLFCYLATIVSTTLASEANSAPAAPQKSAIQNSHVQTKTTTMTGEEVFNNNCARCHMPPMALSPRTTGAVVMHMRVRARLSREDEKLLLKYLAP